MSTDGQKVPLWLLLLGIVGGGFALAALLDSDNKRYVCYNCGKTVKPGDDYCPHCGVELEWSREDG